MNIVYSGEKLYVDLRNASREDVRNAKYKLFGILNEYNIDEVVISTIKKENDYEIGLFVDEYHKSYDGIIRVNYE